MPRVGFEPTTPVFERGKTIHALDRTATVICFLRKILLYELISLLQLKERKLKIIGVILEL
jgi:hypothetical protein